MMRASSRRWILGAVLVSLLSWGLFGALSSTEAKTKASTGAIRADVMRDAWKAGRGMVLEGRYREAIGFLKKYLDLRPRSADAWYWLGRALEGKGDYDHAQYAYRRVMAIDPEYPALSPERRDSWLRPMVVHPAWKAPLLTATRVPGEVLASGDVLAGAPASLDLPPAPPGSHPAEGWVVVSAWMTDPRFTAVGDFRYTVDRMGLMDEPRIPVAWKGNRPSVVYAWTGDGWFTLRPEETESPQDVLGRSRPLLLARTQMTGWVLGRESEQYLPVQVRSWRFQWMGTILTPR